VHRIFYASINIQIRSGSLKAQTGDKGFVHFIRHFKPLQEVAATIWVEKGWQGEHGWAAFIQQGRHRCILSGCLLGRPADEAEEDTAWEALSTCDQKVHNEYLFFPEVFTYVLDTAWDYLHDLK
jgi:hypothetical protein